jgi:Resolvase, N terminal domain
MKCVHKDLWFAFMKAKRIAVYGRDSTDAQSHASQLREVRAYVRRRWPKAEVTEYLDKTSGARFSREGLDALMAAVRQGPCRCPSSLQAGPPRPKFATSRSAHRRV